MDAFRGKTIVITGASRGIGHAIALKLATHGANLVLLANDFDGLEAHSPLLRDKF